MRHDLTSRGSRGSRSLPYLVLTREIVILLLEVDRRTSKAKLRELRELRELTFPPPLFHSRSDPRFTTFGKRMLGISSGSRITDRTPSIFILLDDETVPRFTRVLGQEVALWPSAAGAFLPTMIWHSGGRYRISFAERLSF